MTACPRALALLLLLAPLAAAAQPGPAPPEEQARVHARTAQRHFDARDYDAAARELRAAIRIDPRPAYVYALGQALRLGGDCAGAVRSYRRFLATAPPAGQAEAARANIARCDAEMAAGPATQPQSAPGALPPAEAPSRPRWRWYADVIGGGLSGAGLAVAVTGSVLLGVGRGAAARANRAATYDDYLANADGAAAMQRAGVTLLALGGALIVGGVVRYVLRFRRRAELPAVTAALGPDGAGVLLRGRF